MKPSLVLSSLSIAAITQVMAQPNSSTGLIANTRQGPVRGIEVQNTPPLNRVSDGHSNVLNATKFGPVCHQFHYRTILGDSLVETSGQSEDCLTLNVFVPRHAFRRKNGLLPVFVWSYGGAFGEGGASMPLFNPTQFVAENKDVIVVTWNYRLNIFGFPNTPDLGAQNLGLRDQRAALEWLRDNIAGFGGDAHRITLGGQSAGADSGSAMIYSHMDDPIFSGLILQSGTVQIIGAATQNVDSEFVRVATSVGCANSADRLQELECMRTVNAEVLMRAISDKTLNAFGAPSGGTPMVDNVTLFTMREYVHRGSAGKFAKIPTLMGHTKNEGDSILNWTEKCGVNKTLSDLATALIFNCNMALEAGFRYVHRVPTWRYRYAGVFPAVTPFPWARAYHQADIPMLMGTYNLLAQNKTREHHAATIGASRYLQQMFGAFIRDPSHGLEEMYQWPTFVPGLATLIDLFPNNTASAEFKISTQDEMCMDAPPFPWIEVLKAPPRC
ncbi:carboxylesterase family protein, partial [Metarhizium hybridum]